MMLRRKSSKIKAVLSVGTAIIHVTMAGQVFAQASDQGVDRTDTADIIVTAQRRAQRLSEVPLSLTAIGGAALQERNLVDVADLSKLVPGLSVSDSGYATPIYTLRGVGVNETSLGSSPSVAVYVDQVPLPYPVLTQGATLDLERLEVVKGPQGTLYGQNATGGAINYIANKPTDTLSAGATATFGRFSRGSVEGFVSGPLGEGIKARLAGQAQFGDGWQTSMTRGDTIGKIKKYSGRFILDLVPSDTVRFTFNANGWIDKSDTIAPQLISFPGSALASIVTDTVTNGLFPTKARETDWGPDSDFVRDDKFWQMSLRADWDLTDEVTLTSITAYGDLNRHQKSELDGLGKYNVLWSDQSGSIKTFAQEARLTANFHGVTWVLGANIGHDKTKDFVDQDLRDSTQVIGLPATGAGYFNNQTIKNWSVFTNIDISLTSQLKLGAGVRLSSETRSFEGCSTNRDTFSAAGFTRILNNFRTAAGLPLAANVGVGDCITFYATPETLALDRDPNVNLFEFTKVSLRQKENNVPWNVNLSWNPARDALLYARVSRGFKAGNFSTLGSTDAQGFSAIQQEKLTAYELGGRVSFARWLNMEAAVFRYDYINKQVRARVNVGPPFGNINAQVNIPESRIKGAELAVTLRPVRGLTLGASGTYLDAKVREYTGFTVFNTIADFAGTRLPFTPKWTMNLDGRFEAPLSDGLKAFVGANMAYRSKTSSIFIDPNEAPRPTTQVNDRSFSTFGIKAYTLVDMQVGVEGDNWKAFVWGKNIFDTYYWTNATRVSTVNIRFPGQPATYGVTLGYKF